MNIPHMGGRTIGPWLELFAMEAEPGTAIIELGAWLGAGTEFLARGCIGNNVDVHTFDIFMVKGNEVQKAEKQGVYLNPKQDTLPLVQSYLSKYENIVYHKGNIADTIWIGPQISLHVDDACKSPKQFKFAINHFSPFWIPGKTVVVLMDYYFYKKRPDQPELICQKEYIENHGYAFEFIRDWPELACAAFKYLGGDVKYI